MKLSNRRTGTLLQTDEQDTRVRDTDIQASWQNYCSRFIKLIITGSTPRCSLTHTKWNDWNISYLRSAVIFDVWHLHCLSLPIFVNFFCQCMVCCVLYRLRMLLVFWFSFPVIDGGWNGDNGKQLSENHCPTIHACCRNSSMLLRHLASWQTTLQLLQLQSSLY